MTRMTLSDFEARYVESSDPWGYTDRAYEQDKYAATLRACGPGPFAEALELGCSIGVFSARLAQRCRHLTAIDAAPTAVARARERLAGMPQAEVVVGAIPAAIPPGRFDLVVASEILYYLDAGELTATLAHLGTRMAAGARLVAVHWRPPGPERPLDAAQVHARLDACAWLARCGRADTDDYLLGAWEHR